MYYGYTGPELMTFGVAAALIIWAFWRIFSGSRLGSNFFFWFVIFAVIFSLWAWRSGSALDLYIFLKTEIATPDF